MQLTSMQHQYVFIRLNQICCYNIPTKGAGAGNDKRL